MEFTSRGEPAKLMTFYSTCDRKRGTTKLWLVGNTISRVCPYLEDWGLQEIVRHQKQGTIKTITIHNEENDVVMALEYCKSSGGNTMAIGSASTMIDKGNWQSTTQPKLPKSYKEYKVLFKIMFQFQSFKFIGEYLRDSEKNKCWFIKPYNGEIKDKIIVISDKINVSKYWQTDIYKITINNVKLQKILNTFVESNIFYSDDLTGTDFKQAKTFQIRR